MVGCVNFLTDPIPDDAESGKPPGVVKESLYISGVNMGQYAKRLQKKLASKSSGLPTKEPNRRPGDPLPGGATDMETLIKQGYDPIHAA